MIASRAAVRAGLTLIELLVAMAIFGILLGAVTAFLSGSIRFSSVAITSADRTRELNDVTSYLLDRAREASSVAVGTCGAAAAHCAVLTVPVLDQVGLARQIEECQQLAFVVEPRATTAVPALVLPADAYLDGAGAGRVIVAYLQETPVAAAGGTCSSIAASAGAAVGGAGWEGPFLVLDGLPAAGAAGSSVPANIFTIIGGDLQISIQVANATRAGPQFTPPGGTYIASVSLRNR